MKTKGQAVFEFIVAAVLFFAIIFYIINFLDANVSTYSAGSQLNSLETKAMEISEYLVHVNLTKDWPVLSYGEIDHLNDVCNNDYTGTLEKFDIGDDRLKMQIYEGSNILLECEQGKTVPDIQKAEVERFALSENNNFLNIKVIVW
jgi:hypothetical protein